MKKSVPDDSSPRATYEVPANVKALVAAIEKKAASVYPDHTDSQQVMVRQELIDQLSKTTDQLMQLSVSAVALADVFDQMAPGLKMLAEATAK